jgi:glycosyltransferase involved in cell wall biosynthesis
MVRVSVVIPTFNHERFIAQAIESVLAQRATFDYELLIGEDHSTDGTAGIVARYASKHPAVIRATIRDRNIGATRNLADLLRACRGSYVALLEGDDYWTSPTKLQKQVAFLDRRQDCALSFHSVAVLHEDGSKPPYVRRPWHGQEVSTLRDLLKRNYITTCSVMLRRSAAGNFPDWYYSLLIDDWPHFALAACHGDIGYIDDVMAVYRVHPGGVWSRLGRTEQQLMRLQAFNAVNAHFHYRYDNIIRRATAECCYVAATGYDRAGDPAAAGPYAVQSLLRRPHGSLKTRADLARILLKCYAPGIHRALRAAKRKVRNLRLRTSVAPSLRVDAGSATG